jgi:hypothetical protein
MNYSIGKIQNKNNLFSLTMVMAMMAAATATSMSSGCEDCEYKTEQWEEQMYNATGPPCPDGMQEVIYAMYYACGGCDVDTYPNFWNVTVGSEWDDTNNATRDAVEVFGCSGAHSSTVFSLGLGVLMSVMAASITALE